MFFFLRHGCATASVFPAWMTIMREGDATLRHGRLKIFLGAAPGVGKTVTMLKEAQQRRGEGRDVVVGLIETHGRRSTEALVAELELVPRKKIEYRGAPHSRDGTPTRFWRESRTWPSSMSWRTAMLLDAATPNDF